MAEVKIKLCVSHSCCDKGVFTLSDNTGPYDATLNPYGWGVGNIEISDVETSFLTITTPDGAIHGPYDVSASIPSLAGTTLEVDLSAILGTTDAYTYSDGVYAFDWVVTGVYGNDDTPFTSRCVVERFPLCSVECCVDKLVSKSTCKCGKGDKKPLNAYLALVSAKGAWKSKKKEEAKKHLSELQDICNNNCKNC